MLTGPVAAEPGTRLAEEKHCRQHRSNKWVDVGDDLGQEPKFISELGVGPHVDSNAAPLISPTLALRAGAGGRGR
jgi:hypothetical protein